MTTTPPIQVPEAWELDSGLRDDMVLQIHQGLAPPARRVPGRQAANGLAPGR